MPTSGEASLARKKRFDQKTRSTSSIKSKKCPTATTINSRLPAVAKKSSSNRGKENTKPVTTNKPRIKAKPAPDFSKLHNKWNSQFQKGKAVVKKTNTQVKPFVLTENINKNRPQTQLHSNRDDDTESNIEDEFEVDPGALQGILSNTGIEVQETHKPQKRATFAATQQSSQNIVLGYSTKRASIYYVGNKENTRHQQGAQTHSYSSSNLMPFQKELKKSNNSTRQEVLSSQDDDDEISFKPDAMALQSILNNRGIDNKSTSRHTMASTRTMPFAKRQSIYEDKQSKRTSIYYNGTRSITTESSRQSLSGWSGTQEGGRIATIGRPTTNQYSVGSTVVGVHDDGPMRDDNDDDEITFKPDSTALQSILNNKGIDNKTTSRHTMASTRTMPFANKRQSIFEDKHEKRTSIYFTGNKTSRTANDRPSLLASNLPNYTIPTPTPSRQNHNIPTPCKTQYSVGSTVIGFQHATPLKESKENEINTFTRPLIPERRKEPKEQEVKPPINMALMTPSRGELDTKSQAPISSKKQVSWSDVLTPHRNQQTVVHNKGGSILKMPANKINYSTKREETTEKRAYPVTTSSKDASLYVNQSPTLDSMSIAMKLFTEDDTTTIISDREKLQLEELEKQAMEDLQLLELEENSTKERSDDLETRMTNNDNNVMTTLSINISGCVPLTSPPEVICTPSTLRNTPWKIPVGSQTNTRDQWIAATPENHMHVTIRAKTPQSKTPIQRHLPEQPRRLATPGGFTAPTPIKTPVRMPVGDVAFGLLSSIKKYTANRPNKTTVNQQLLKDTVYSSTPGIDVTALWNEPAVPSYFSGISNSSLASRNNQVFCGPVKLDVNAARELNVSSRPNLMDCSNTFFNEEDTLQLDEPVSSTAFQQSYRETHAPNSLKQGVSSEFKNGHFTSKNVTVSLKRNVSQISTNCSTDKNNFVEESLSLRSSLKPKVKRVNCITPATRVAKSTSRELASVKEVSLPSASLTYQALLDAEVTLFSTLGKRIKKPCNRNLQNPLTKLFHEGDSQHFVPVCLCTETINCPIHASIR